MNSGKGKMVQTGNQRKKRRPFGFLQFRIDIRGGQNGQLWARMQKSPIQPYGFEENINTNIKDFKSGRSNGRIKRYGRPKFITVRNRYREGQNGQFWVRIQRLPIRPYGFGKNVNTIIKDFESVRSDDRIERYRQLKFVRSRSNQANSSFFERERFPIQP